MSKLKNFIYALTVVLLFLSYVSAQKKCMFIGADPGPGGKISENASYDRHIMPLIQEWGYTVDKKHNCQDLPKYTDADYEPYDFIFLSESIFSPHIHPLRNIRKPMLCAEGMAAKHSAMGFADSDKSIGLLHPGKPVVFLEGAKDHPLAAGYAPGDVANFGNYSKNCLMTWGTPTIPVISIAGVQGSQQRLAVYGVEKGTKNSHGEVINHRVAVVGTHAWCYTSAARGEPMINLMKAGIKWILEEDKPTSINSIKPVNTDYFGLSHNKINSIHSITYSVPKKAEVTLTVWNVSGQKIKTLVNDIRAAGKYTANLNASNIPNGMYFLTLDVGNMSCSTKIPFTN